jgi:succinate-semialdehyde dehydrogenase/glutarate-semialdehyde dehydrogenase
VITGASASQEGAFYAPTVLSGVSHESPIARTEIFGPVTSVIEYDDVDDAVRMANDTIYGLIAYVYGETAQALAVAQRLDAGMIAVNRAVLSDPAAPFGGMKQSGMGREGSSEGILEFLEEKYIGIDL